MIDGQLKKWIAEPKPILLDGAMGTMLHGQGFSFDRCLDQLNLTHPEAVRSIHEAYYHAGAQVIETNSFGANHFKLSKHGLEHQVQAINQAAVDLARAATEAGTQPALVAASVGPLGVRLAPFGRVQPKQAYDAFYEQIQALIQAGADLLMIETHNDLHELKEAIRAARDLSDLPIIASMTFTRDDRTLLGDTASQVAHALVESGADILGANCSDGPAQLLRIAAEMKSAADGLPIAIWPNAGWPERVANRILYPATPDYFKEFALTARQIGIDLIGGCCGTTPEHIEAMQHALELPPAETNGSQSFVVSRMIERDVATQEEPTELAGKLAEREFVLSVELDPPRGFSTHKALAGAHLLAEAGADVINVADSPMARMRMSPWAVCQLIQSQVELETVLHFPTRGRNLLRVQGDLLASHALGVRNLFVVMGDPTAVGDYPEAMDNYDLVPTGLIRLVKQSFNVGVDHAGSDIGGATSFFVGCALNLGAQDLEREVGLLKKKLDCGADFALTQPVFEPEPIDRFMEAFEARYGPLELPILIGLLPLYSDRHASFLHNEVPGINIPEATKERVGKAGDEGPRVGVELATSLLEQLQNRVQGAYLMPPFGRYDMAAEIIEAVKS
ncbi:MAG: bifunctional homocysteine S-methyltransferase/methylenetetrahydrofolate reductase [Anaerolineales bacterium]